MLTVSILMEALSNPYKMKMSQNKLAVSFNTTPSTVNAWIRKNSRPQMDAAAFCDGISACHKSITSCDVGPVFIQKLINCLDISPAERDFLNVQFGVFKNRFPSDSACSKKFLTHLVQLAMEQAEIRNILHYEPFNPARPVIGIGVGHVIAVRDDGRVLSTGANDYQQCGTHPWRDVVSAAAGWRSSIGLKADGTCIAIGRNTVGNGEMTHWNSLTAVCCGNSHFLGLRVDGTVVAYGLAGDGQCEVSGWKHIKSLAAGSAHSVGLCEDGTVVACGSNREGQCEVSSWKNVVQIAAAGDHTVALTADGRILLAGNKYIYSFAGWSDLAAIATGLYHIVGLKKDGTVLNTGNSTGGLDAVFKWWDVRAVFAGYFTTAGIRSDGSVLITNDSHSRIYLNTSSWNLFGGHSTKSEGPSPVEAARADAVSALEAIHETGLRLAPSLNGTYLDIESAKLLENLLQLSKDSMKIREKYIQIKPLADQILLYNAAFLDFFGIFSFDDEKKLYRVSADAYPACVEFLTAVRQVLAGLRSI